VIFIKLIEFMFYFILYKMENVRRPTEYCLRALENFLMAYRDFINENNEDILDSFDNAVNTYMDVFNPQILRNFTEWMRIANRELLSFIIYLNLPPEIRKQELTNFNRFIEFLRRHDQNGLDIEYRQLSLYFDGLNQLMRYALSERASRMEQTSVTDTTNPGLGNIIGQQITGTVVVNEQVVTTNTNTVVSVEEQVGGPNLNTEVVEGQVVTINTNSVVPVEEEVDTTNHNPEVTVEEQVGATNLNTNIGGSEAVGTFAGEIIIPNTIKGSFSFTSGSSNTVLDGNVKI
jgi:hypothetical protein